MRSKILILSIFSLFLTGCWDQRLLKDSRLVFGSAFDLTEDNSIRATAVIRDFINGTPTNNIVSATGHTPRETRVKMDSQVSGSFAPSKNRVFLIGKELAKKDIYSFLDVFYRDPNSSLSSKIAVADGEAADILKVQQVGNVLIAEYLTELIESEEKATHAPKENVQAICTAMFDPGVDFALPLIKLKDKAVMNHGLALFHKRSFTGKLSLAESTLMLLFADKKAANTQIVTKLKKSNELSSKNYIAYTVVSSKSDYKMDFSSNSLKIPFKLKLKINVVEFSEDKLASTHKIEKLNKELSVKLTADARKMMEKLQDARCDIYGFGRELMAFHPEEWKKMNWEKDYKTVEIQPKVTVEIVGTGIIN